MVLFLFLLLVPLSLALPQDSENRQTSSAGQVFQNMLQFPQNVIQSIAGSRSGSRIGDECQYTTDCLETTKNSVCFNATCLCNLGYRYKPLTDECATVDPCPTCDTSACDSGKIDINCDNSCSLSVTNFKRLNVDDSSRMLKSHLEWPSNYAPDTEAYYCLKAPAGRRVNLKLLWLDLESHCGHACDSITVYNGCVAAPENILAFYTGDNASNNECITSYCNELMIKFKTDADDGFVGDQRSGFMGYFTESLYEEDKCSYAGVKKPAE